MKIKFKQPSPMNFIAIEDKQNSENVLVGKPIRYARTQKIIPILPFEVITEAGITVDKGFLSLNVKTGKLMIETCMKEVEIDADK